MSSGTKREETRKVATWCAVSAHMSSQALTATRIAGFKPLRHPSYSPDMSPSDLLPKLEKIVKGWQFNDDSDVICTLNGWLEDQDQEFFYNAIRALENR